MKFELPDAPITSTVCRACGLERTLDEFRVYTLSPKKLLMDFCFHCEQKQSTLQLYRKFNAYGTPEIIEAVFRASRVPEDKRNAEQARLLVEPTPDQPIESPEQLVQFELQRRELARRRLLYFVTTMMPTYTPGWVHQDICRRLERFMKQVERRESPRLMIFMPPRAGKSQLASDMLPSWILGHHPEWEVIASSYAQSLPLEFSRKIRDRMDDPEYKVIFPNAAIRSDARGIEAWRTTAGGGYVAAGVGTGITGKGFHVGIVDDPIKDHEEAASDVIRDNAYKWYQSTFRTRAAPGAGILFINCMVGDTAVLMADGSLRHLKDIKVGDRVATYDDGVLATSVVSGWINHGVDSVYEIKTSSGTLVRANKRHPFLVARNGATTWVRVQHLRVGDQLLRVTGGSGRASFAQKQAVTSLSHARGSATSTTKEIGGRVGLGRRLLSTLINCVRAICGIGTVSNQSSTTPFSLSKAVNAQYAESLPKRLSCRDDVATCSSTIATIPTRSEGFSVTIATSRSEQEKLSASYSGPLSTCVFTPDQIVEIVEAGREDVFDIQVERTENFIANGLVSHNTRWHHDDPAGRLLADDEKLAKAGIPEHERENWEVVSYPAIATADEYLMRDGSIAADPPNPEDALRLLRRKGDALHPERFSLAELRKIKNNFTTGMWSALYQQQPTPDEGDYFKRSDITYRWLDPAYYPLCRVFITADYAIKKNQHNDFTVLGVFALDADDNLYLIDMRRGRWGTFDIVRNIMALVEMYKPEVYAGEQGQIHEAVWPQVEIELLSKRIPLSVDDTLTPTTDKEVRARPMQARAQRRRLFFSHNSVDRPAEYEVLEKEMLQFPKGVNDDTVDCVAWACRLALNLPLPKLRAPPKLKSWRDELRVSPGSSNSYMAG